MVEKNDSEHENSTHTLWSRLAAMLVSVVLVATVFILVAIFKGGAVSPKREVPHIIFILADDLGWNDVSFHGSPQIPTPNIDALAATGIVLNNYFSHPLCSPSRGALMSGKYANRLGLYEDLKPAQPLGLPLNVPTLPEYLKKLGYKTHMVGKWHLGYHKREYLPTNRGFDTFFGFMNDNIDYYDYTTFYIDKTNFPEEKRLFGIDLWESEEVITNFRGEYATSVFTQKTVEVIEQHNISKISFNEDSAASFDLDSNKNFRCDYVYPTKIIYGPLFLFVSHAACHTGNSFFPLQAPVELTEKNNHIVDMDRRYYAGMVSSLDDSVGDIFKSLKEKGMLSKSLIVLSSDNGGLVGAGSNWPLRGQKGSGWEGGMRSPTIVWSPLLGLKKPRVSKDLLHITDWLPTFYHLSGGDISDLGDIDGLNMWPILQNIRASPPREEIFLYTDPKQQSGSLRKGDMKLLLSPSDVNGSDWYGPSGTEDNYFNSSFDEWIWRNGSIVKDILIEDGMWMLDDNNTWRQEVAIVCGENFLPVSGKCDFTEGPCLYNITDDPCEYRNIAKLYPEIVQSMLERFRDLNASSLIQPETVIDPSGDPICHSFAHMPWLDEELESQQCILSL